MGDRSFATLRARFTSEQLEQPAFVQAVLDAQRSWHRAAAQGCRFAQHISGDYGRHGYYRLVISGIPDPESNIWAEIEHLEADQETQACSVLLPDIDEVGQVVQVVRGLASRDKWRLQEDFDDGFVIFRLRLLLAHHVESWVLGMGPFDCLSRTRQAPCLELAFRPKPKPGPMRSAKLSADATAAHLADLPVESLSQEAFDLAFANTVKTKLAVNRADDPRAKAKVTFAIPASLIPS